VAGVFQILKQNFDTWQADLKVKLSADWDAAKADFDVAATAVGNAAETFGLAMKDIGVGFGVEVAAVKTTLDKFANIILALAGNADSGKTALETLATRTRELDTEFGNIVDEASRAAAELRKLADDVGKVQVKAPEPTVARASGGRIPGLGDADNVPILATPGEWVIKKAAVQHYGEGLMAMLNSMAIPRTGVAAKIVGGVQRFATGGRVAETTSASSKVLGSYKLDINLGNKDTVSVFGGRGEVEKLVRYINRERLTTV